MNSKNILTSLQSEQKDNTVELPEASLLTPARHTSETIDLPSPRHLDATRHESSENPVLSAPVAEQKSINHIYHGDLEARNGNFDTPHSTKLFRKKHSISLSGLSEVHGREQMTVSTDADTESEPDSGEESRHYYQSKF